MKHLSQYINESRGEKIKNIFKNMSDSLSAAIKSFGAASIEEATGPMVDLIMTHVNNLKDIVDLVDQIYDKSIGTMIRDVKFEKEKKEISKILNKIVNDSDVQKWSRTPHKKSIQLRQILISKLDENEIKYIDKLIDRMIDLSAQIDRDYTYSPENSSYSRRR